MKFLSDYSEFTSLYIEIHIWTQTHIFITANQPHKSTVYCIFVSEALGICRLFADYANITACTTHWRYLMQTHTPTHTHDSNNFSPLAACCGSWSAASVDWLSAEKEEEKEEGAAGHEQQRRWRPIGNQCTMSVSAPYGQDTRSDSCHSPLLPGPITHC